MRCVLLLLAKREGMHLEIHTLTLGSDQDEATVAFHDLRPAGKVHILVIPKEHIVSTHHLRNTPEDKALGKASSTTLNSHLR